MILSMIQNSNSSDEAYSMGYQLGFFVGENIVLFLGFSILLLIGIIWTIRNSRTK